MILTFYAAGTAFGIDSVSVREVSTSMDGIRVPGTPDYVSGVTSRYGDIVTLIDFRVKNGAEARQDGRRTGVIYVESNGASIGLIVDEIGRLVPDTETEENVRIITVEDILVS